MHSTDSAVFVNESKGIPGKKVRTIKNRYVTSVHRFFQMYSIFKPLVTYSQLHIRLGWRLDYLLWYRKDMVVNEKCEYANCCIL